MRLIRFERCSKQRPEPREKQCCNNTHDIAARILSALLNEKFLTVLIADVGPAAQSGSFAMQVTLLCTV